MPRTSNVSSLGDAEAAAEDVAHLLGHPPLDLEPDRLAEAPAPELLLDRDQQSLGLLLVQRQVGVAGHPEEVVPQDLHAR